MRVLRGIVTGLLAVFAVIAGLFVAITAAVTGLAFIFARRWLGGSRAANPPSVPGPQPRRRMSPDDAIEVSVSEVPSDSVRR